MYLKIIFNYYYSFKHYVNYNNLVTFYKNNFKFTDKSISGFGIEYNNYTSITSKGLEFKYNYRPSNRRYFIVICKLNSSHYNGIVKLKNEYYSHDYFRNVAELPKNY